MPLGWRQRQMGKAQPERRGPFFTSSAATEALWGELSEPQLYADQAVRYTRSDLVYMCVNKLAEMAAMQRLGIFATEGERDKSGEPTEHLDDHPFHQLWRQPNPWDSSFEFMEATMISLELTGNAYWHLDDGAKPVTRAGERWIEPAGEPIALWLLRPDRVRIIPDKEKYIGAYRHEVAGEKIYIDPGRVVHFKRYHPLRDYEGLSPIEAANFASAADIAAQKSNWYLFRNAMRLSGVVETDRDHVDLNEVALMEKMLKERYTGSPEKAHQVAFLWSQFKYKELGMTMRDAEFVEGTRINRMRIFGIYGVHPGIILSEDVNLANARVGEYVTKAFTLAPKLARIAGDITPILGLWDTQPPAEVRFVDVVPQDVETDARVFDMQASAVQRLVQALGPDAGVRVAVQWGLLPAEIEETGIVPVSMAGAGALRGGDGAPRAFFRRYP